MSKNKQLISNFQAGFAGGAKQLEAQPENGVAYKKTCTSIKKIKTSFENKKYVTSTEV